VVALDIQQDIPDPAGVEKVFQGVSIWRRPAA
jgi:hypothetical protein